MQYYAKLGCLLINHGTEGIRNYFHNHILCGQTLQQFFTTNKTHIDNLRHGRHGCKRLINKRQYDLIFPANNQPPDLNGFDITLIFLLIRQFQVGKIRPNAPVWDDPAKAAGVPQDMQDIILLKFERNSLAHRESNDICLSDFEQKWTTISSAIIRLGVLTPAEIQQLKDKPIEPEREMSYQLCILRGYLEEMEMLKLMQNMDVKLDHIYAKLDDLCKRQDTTSYHCEVQQNLTLQQTNLHFHSHHVHTEGRPERKPEQDILSDDQLTLLQNHLAERYNHEMSCVPRIPWDDTDTMNIDDVFVDLSLIQEQKEGGGTKKMALDTYQDIFKPHIRNKKIIIRGKAGSGKSTIAAKIAVDWAKFKTQSSNGSSSKELLYNRTNPPKTEESPLHYLENMSLLFLISLRFLDKDQTLLESIKDQLIDPTLKISDEALLKYMHSNAERILIILDGYDEYNHANQHNDISKLIKGEILANVTVIVTSRPWKAHELSKHRPSDTHVEINDMSPEKILEFIQSHFKDEDSNFHKSIVQYVEKSHLSLSLTPLLLLFICILWGEKTAEQMPHSLLVLYQELVTLLSDRYTAGQENQETAERYLSEKAKILGKIALDGLLSGNLTFDETNSHISELGEQIFHIGIMSRLKLSSIRRKVNISSYSFIHKTVQEYFAAKFIVESWEEDSQSESINPFLSHINSLSRFQDMANVIQFVCGLSSELAGVIFSYLHVLAFINADFQFEYYAGDWHLPPSLDLNPLFIRFITEMLTNNHVVTPVHMQWLNHLNSDHTQDIYPPTADIILRYADKITKSTFSSEVDACVHKLQYHTVFRRLQALSVITSKYNRESCVENRCVQPNSKFLSGSPMKSLVRLILALSDLEFFLSLDPPFPSLEQLSFHNCDTPWQLVDLFQLLPTMSMVNLLFLDLSHTRMTECETCLQLGVVSKSERTGEYKREPFIVTVLPYQDTLSPAIPGEHQILIDTLCDLAPQLEHLPNLQVLALEDNRITPVGLRSLTDNLHHVPRLQNLHFSNNHDHMGRISNIDMPTLMENFFLKLKSMNMQVLHIHCCNFGAMAPAMKVLSDNLKQWKELRSLWIFGNFIGDDLDLLVDSLNSTYLPQLKKVRIVRDNDLSVSVQKRLVEKLEVMPGLDYEVL